MAKTRSFPQRGQSKRITDGRIIYQKVEHSSRFCPQRTSNDPRISNNKKIKCHEKQRRNQNYQNGYFSHNRPTQRSTQNRDHSNFRVATVNFGGRSQPPVNVNMMVGEQKYAKMATEDRNWRNCNKLFSEKQCKGVNLDQYKQSILFKEIS